MKNTYSSTSNPVHIIMVTWNAIEYTKYALDSLFLYTDLPYVLTVVDNGSSDGTQQYLHSLIPKNNCLDISIIENATNVGYGEAINQAYATRQTEFACVVNNDVYFSPGWLNNMVSSIQSDPSIGIIGPLRPLSWCHHPYSNESTDAILESLPNTLSPVDELDAYCREHPYEDFARDVTKINDFGIKYLTGPPIHIVTCCALVRSSIIDRVGGLSDPIFKVFGSEDTDLSWRISTGGYKLAVTSSAYVHHFKHKSADANSFDRKEYCRLNNEIFYDKWKETIHTFLREEMNKGVDVPYLLSNEDDYNYWFLRRLRENIDKKRFWGTDSITEKTTYKNLKK